MIKRKQFSSWYVSSYRWSTRRAGHLRFFYERQPLRKGKLPLKPINLKCPPLSTCYIKWNLSRKQELRCYRSGTCTWLVPKQNISGYVSFAGTHNKLPRHWRQTIKLFDNLFIGYFVQYFTKLLRIVLMLFPFSPFNEFAHIFLYYYVAFLTFKIKYFFTTMYCQVFL